MVNETNDGSNTSGIEEAADMALQLIQYVNNEMDLQYHISRDAAD